MTLFAPEAPAFVPVMVVIPGRPVGKQRPRRGHGPGVYTPEATVNYEAKVMMCGRAAMAGRPPLAEAVDVAMEIVVPIRPSWPKAKQALARAGELRPVGKPDGDNVLKSVSDGLNGAVWVDDSQMVTCLMWKRYGELTEEGVQIRIFAAGTLVTGFPSVDNGMILLGG